MVSATVKMGKVGSSSDSFGRIPHVVCAESSSGNQWLV